jgi:hypothetical protein
MDYALEAVLSCRSACVAETDGYATLVFGLTFCERASRAPLIVARLLNLKWVESEEALPGGRCDTARDYKSILARRSLLRWIVIDGHGALLCKDLRPGTMSSYLAAPCNGCDLRRA